MSSTNSLSRSASHRTGVEQRNVADASRAAVENKQDEGKRKRFRSLKRSGRVLTESERRDIEECKEKKKESKKLLK